MTFRARVESIKLATYAGKDIVDVLATWSIKEGEVSTQGSLTMMVRLRDEFVLGKYLKVSVEPENPVETKVEAEPPPVALPEVDLRLVDATLFIHVMGSGTTMNVGDLARQGWSYDKEGKVAILPWFSSDPTSSRNLMSKMESDGWAYSINSPLPWSASRTYMVRFWKAGSKTSHGAEASSRELATALAALKTRGLTVDPVGGVR